MIFMNLPNDSYLQLSNYNEIAHHANLFISILKLKLDTNPLFVLQISKIFIKIFDRFTNRGNFSLMLFK